MLKWGIYGVIILSGVCRAFLQPSRTALSAQMVPRVLYPRAIAWRTGVFQLCRRHRAGAAAACSTAGWAATGAYLASLVLLLAARVTMLGMRVHPRSAGPAPAPPLSQSVREGLRFLLGDPVLLPAITLDLFAVLFGGAVALLPIFAEEILQVGPEGFGLLRAAPAAGALLASAVLAFAAARRQPAGRFLLTAWPASAWPSSASRCRGRSRCRCCCWPPAERWTWSASWCGRPCCSCGCPTQMLGRVAAINQIFIGSSNEIGAFESGVAARLLGTVPSVVRGERHPGGGGLCAWRAPALRRLGPLVP